MKMFTCMRTKIFVMLLLALTFSASSVVAQGFSQQTRSRLQQALQNFQDDPSFVGGISAAVKVDGLAFWEGATGYAARNVDAENNLLPGGTDFTTNTLSRIYSVTKTFTAALVLELASEGALSLDDHIGTYMPYMQLYNPGLNSNVTIRQLLNHESGYSDWEEEIQLQMAIAFDPNHEWTPYELVAFTHQLSAPGAVRRYSHNNFVFLGAIVEAATGRQIEDLYRERFFTPLQLNSLYLEGRELHGDRAPLAAPHDNISVFNPIFVYTHQPTFPDANTNISVFPFAAITSLGFAGGGLIANVADLAEWGNALFGGRATSKAVLDSMLQSISSTPDEYGNKLGYGIKNTPSISGAFDFIGHNGSAPGYRSIMYYNPERKMTIAVLTNFAGISPYDIAKALFEALPEFTSGNPNRKEYKIKVCFNGNSITVDRNAAAGFIRKGAYLGDCETSDAKRINTNEVTVNLIKTSLEAFPNPSSGQVYFSFITDETGPVTLDLFDANGKLMRNIYKGNLQKGTLQEVVFVKGNSPAGVYIASFKTNSGITQKKIVFTK